jgi:hypothetical protein
MIDIDPLSPPGLPETTSLPGGGFGAARHPQCLRKGTLSLILLTAWWI